MNPGGVRTDGFFAADLNSDPRFVWDPVVHKSQGEDCFFLLLRLREQRRAVVDRIAESIRDNAVRSVCIYKLYGYYDVLIRVWAPRTHVLTVQSQLAEFAENAQVVLVSVYKAFYDDWTIHRADLTESTVDSFSHDIEILTDPDLHPGRDDVEQAVRRLADQRLIHYLDPAAAGLGLEGNLIKIYLALSDSGAEQRNYGEDAIVVRRALETLTLLRLKSVYWSPNDHFPFLVKGVIPAKEFPDLDRALDMVEKEFSERNVHLRCMTLIIANVDAPEADLLSPSIPAVGGTPWHRLVRNISADAGKALRNDSPRYVACVVELFDTDGRAFLGSDSEEILRSIFEALSSRKTPELARSLQFLQGFEGLLRRFFEAEMFETAIGLDWSEGAREILRKKQSKSDREKRPDIDPTHLTFQQIVMVAGSLASADAVLDKKVHDVLGPKWGNRLNAATRVRNWTAHGDLQVDWSWNAQGHHSWRDITSVALSVLDTYTELLKRYPQE